MIQAEAYRILGLPATASLQDVKQAHRREVKQCHPDLFPDRTVRFRLVQEAYETLLDPAIKPAAAPRPTPTPPPPPPPKAPPRSSDPFAQFHARKPAGPGMRQVLDISLEQVFLGTTTILRHPSGSVEIVIPPGVENNQEIALPKALPGFGNQRMDASVVVKVRPHARFRRDGANLRARIYLDASTARQGQEMPIQGIDGRNLRVRVPPNAAHGQTICLPRQGLPFGRSGRGDLLVEVLIRS